MNPPKFVDAALPLISLTADGKMEVGKQALEILAAVPRPLAVVGVAGQYRTGKSYLLNRVILDQNKGFAVGPTTNPCTKGVWMWGRPVKAFSKEGKPVSLVVLDSEGLGAFDTDTGHDARIFALVLLLSSVFVYNSTGTIDESALENLSLVVDLTKNVQLKSRPAPDDADLDDFQFYMPAFVWVVRDFALELVDRHHHPITSDEYFEEALVEQDGDSDQVEQKNRIRRALQAFFPDRHCATLVRPVHDEEQLKNIEALRADQLRPEFVSQVAELRGLILDAAKVKTLEGHPLSGEMLGDLVKSYVAAFNSQKVPVIETCWAYVAKNECHKAKEAAVKRYDDEMAAAFAKRWPLGKKALKDLHRECFDAALRQFRGLDFGETQRKFEEDLVFELRKMYQDFKYENETEFEAQFKKAMEGLFAERVGTGLRNKTYKSHLDLENDLKFLEKEIRESGLEGPHKAIFTAEFIAKKQAEAFRAFSAAARDEAEAQLREQREARRVAEAEAESARQGAEKERKKTEARLAELAADLDNAQKKARLVEESLQRLKAEKEKAEGFYEQRLKEAAEEAGSQARELQRERDQLAEERNAARKEMVEVRAQNQSEVALLQNQVRILEERKAALSASDRTKEEEMDRLQMEFQVKTAELAAKAEALAKDKNARIEQLNEELLEAEERLLTMEKALAGREAELEASEKNAKRLAGESKAKLEQAAEKIKALERQSAQKNSGTVSAEKHAEVAGRAAELEEAVKQREQALRQAKQQLEKEVALNRQAADNAQLKFEEMKKKFDDLNSDYERLISLSEHDANDRQEDLARQLTQAREEHAREVQGLEAQTAILNMKLEEEARRFAEDKAALEQEKAEFEAGMRAEAGRLRLALEKAEKAAKSAALDAATAKAEAEEELGRVEEKARVAVMELEEALESAKKAAKAELREVLRKKEEDLKQMQGAFEEEREALEGKWGEEKEKLAAKIAQLNRQAEGRVEDVRREFEEALEAKDLELAAQRESFQLTEQALRSESATRLQRLAEQTEQMKVLSEKYENYKRFADERIRQMQSDFEAEHEGLVRERDGLKKQLNEVENKQWETQNELAAAVSDLAKVREAATAELRKAEGDLQAARAEAEAWKGRAESAGQGALQQKTELEKQLVMAQQTAKFKAELNDELKRKLDYEKSKADERLRVQKELLERERTGAEQKQAEALKAVEAKLNEKRKTQRELETKLELKTAEADKARAALEEKVAALQADLAAKESWAAEKVAKLKEKARTAKEAAERTGTACEARLKEAGERVRELEDRVFDLQGTIDKDAQIHAENKLFYQGQIEKLKSEAENSQRRFDLIFNKFNKKKDQESQEGQAAQNQIIQSLSENHRGQISELTQKYSLEVKTLTEKNQKLERELRQVREGLVADTRAKLDNYDLLESSVVELRESEKALQRQLAQLRAEKDAKIKALETRYGQDVERLKSKAGELERALAEQERAAEAHKFSAQTDKTRLANQIESLKANAKSLREQLKESEEAREGLLEQVEKLKSQSRKDRALAGGSGAQKWGRGATFNAGRGGDATIDGGDSMTNESRAREMKDLSRAFAPDDASDPDISTNKIL